MTVVNEAASYRKAVLGALTRKAYPTLAVETKSLFTVSGLVLATSIVGRVTTAITVANTIKLQHNPTTGTTQDLCAATDLGTTDTPAGDLITLAGGAATAPVVGIGAVNGYSASNGIFLDAGVVEQVTATGADGGITWFITWVPLEDTATVVAA